MIVDDKKRVSLYIDADILQKIDNSMKKSKSRSRNEFLIEAAQFYMGYLNKDNDARFLTESVDLSISSSVTKMEDRIAKVLFKFAVEMSMMMHLLAANLDLQKDTMSSLRRQCIDELKKSSGYLSFEKTMNKMNDE